MGNLCGRGGKSIDNCLLETCKHLADGLVHAINTSDRTRAGNDADSIGIKTGILRLPERIRSPPASQIAIKNRNERHRLVVLAAQDREPGDIGGDNASRLSLGVGLKKARQSCLAVLKILAALKESRNIAVIGGVQARLDAVEEIQSAIRPRPIRPGVGQVDDAACPLGVGHFGQFAEVGLGRLVHGFNEVIAACIDCLKIGANLVNKSRCTCGGVLDLVHVGAQVRQARGHSTANLSATDPTIFADTGGVLEELLDLRGSLSFQSRHRGRAHEHRIDGHRRGSQVHGPLAGDVTGRIGSRTDTAANSQDDVGSATNMPVGRQEQIVQVFPRVVATRVAVFDLNNQRVLGVRAGNAQDLLDLLHGSGLQAQVLKTIGAQLGDQLAGLVQFGNARSNGHGVDGSTGAASLGDNPVDAELEVPHEAVKEHRVETGAATGFEKLLKLQAVLGEDLFGVLSATGHFRPVSGVSCRCDDPRTNGRRGHTGKNNGRATRQAREGG